MELYQILWVDLKEGRPPRDGLEGGPIGPAPAPAACRRVPQMSANRPPWRPGRRLLLVALVAVAVAAVAVVLVASPDDESSWQIRSGAPGYPLRGDRATDRALLEDAADAWWRRDHRDEDDGAAFRDGKRRVSALWAGRIGDTDAVVLAHESTVALLQRTVGRSYIEVADQELPFDLEEPSRHETPLPLAFDDATLLPEGARTRFWPASAPRRDDPGRPSLHDGLWTSPDRVALQPGVLELTGGPQPWVEDVTTAVLDERVVLIDRPIADRLPRLDLPARQRLIAAGSDDGRSEPAGLPVLRFVLDEPLPTLGATTVLARRTLEAPGLYDRARDRVVAAVGGSAVAGRDEATALAIDPRDARDPTSPRATTGPALAAQYLVRSRTVDPKPLTVGDERQVPSRPVLLVAGDERIARIEVRVGRQVIARPGPVAVIPATWQPEDLGTVDRDLSVAGFTRGGSLVAASGPSNAVTTAADRD